MKKIIITFCSVFLMLGCAQQVGPYRYDKASYQVDAKATAQAAWKVGEVFERKEIKLMASAVRMQNFDGEIRFLGINKQGLLIVQQFYVGSNQKASDPYLMEARPHGNQVTAYFSQGFLTTYFPSGNKHSEYHLVDTHPIGQTTFWYEGGSKLSEQTVQNGLLEGQQIIWHENGQVKSKLMFKNGKLDGEQATWYESGRPLALYNTQEGYFFGKQTQWYESGKIKVLQYYDAPNLTWPTRGQDFDENGNVTHEVTPKNPK